jgi:hypothetical protein
MNRGARRSVPLLLAWTVALASALMACASAPRTGPVAQTSPQPALAGAVAVVPAAAGQVTLSMNYGMNANGRKPPAPVTITGSAKVSEVAGLVTSQPPWPPGTYSCPAADGMALDLTFRARPGSPALATAILELNGCGGTDLTRGRQGLQPRRAGLGPFARDQGACGRRSALETPALHVATGLVTDGLLEGEAPGEDLGGVLGAGGGAGGRGA